MEPSYLTDADNGSVVSFFAADSPFPSAAASADVEALRRLSENLGSLFRPPDYNDPFADAHIAVGNAEVGVHRCVLASRSPFFRAALGKLEKGARMEMKDLGPGLGVGFDALVAVVGYLYGGTVCPIAIGVCECADDDCPHAGCRPAVDFMLEVLYASFVFKIPELVSLFQRRLLDILEKVAIDDIPIDLSVAILCGDSCTRLLTRCIEIVVESDIDIVTLEKALPPEVVKQVTESRLNNGYDGPDTFGFPDKHVRRIHRALDSDDVELIRMLLKEGQTSLDDAYALHYAVEHCDSKVTTELLDLALADVNHRNLRGYTVLHVGAMRKDPKIIVSLLTKGARPADLTLDGMKALQISKRLTKSVDYYRSTEEGKASPKDRLCIEILEQAERRDPHIGEASNSLAIAGDDLRGKLLYLENRVALARLLFPMEAKVAMDIAQVDGTLEFNLSSASNISAAKQGTTVDLNEAPFKIKEEHLARMRALSRTVELGKRFFPRCSEVLNSIMDDELDLSLLRNDTSAEQKNRYIELRDALTQAFSEDKEEFSRSGISSSSSSTSMGVARKRKK